MRKINSNAFQFIIVFALVIGCFYTKNILADDLTTYESAKASYFNGEYDQTEGLLLALLQRSSENGYLLFDLGNVYYKKGHLGQALQYYEKAKTQLPRYQDLSYNLAVAQKQLGLSGQGTLFRNEIVSKLFFWIDTVSLTELGLVKLFLSCIFWLFLLFKFFRKIRLFDTKTVILGLLLLYITVGAYFLEIQRLPGAFGVVLVAKTQVQSNYLGRDKPLFEINEGTKVRIIDRHEFSSSEIWLHVALPQGQHGWVLADKIGII